jgi:hypothetical protein
VRISIVGYTTIQKKAAYRTAITPRRSALPTSHYWILQKG